MSLKTKLIMERREEFNNDKDWELYLFCMDIEEQNPLDSLTKDGDYLKVGDWDGI